jgi:hypothetical protein
MAGLASLEPLSLLLPGTFASSKPKSIGISWMSCSSSSSSPEYLRFPDMAGSASSAPRCTVQQHKSVSAVHSSLSSCTPHCYLETRNGIEKLDMFSSPPPPLLRKNCGTREMTGLAFPVSFPHTKTYKRTYDVCLVFLRHLWNLKTISYEIYGCSAPSSLKSEHRNWMAVLAAWEGYKDPPLLFSCFPLSSIIYSKALNPETYGT